MKKIITLGNCVVDCYDNVGKSFAGGNALNVAVQSKKLGVEKSSIISLVGDDEEGEKIKKELEALQIDVTKLRKSQGNTSRVTIDLDEYGDRTFLRWDKGVQDLVEIKINNQDINHIEKHDVLHTNSLDMFLKYIEKRNRAIKLSFDFSIERKKKMLTQLCPHLTFAFFSANDLNINESKSLINDAHKYGAKFVIVTRGGENVLFSDKNRIYIKEVEKVEVIDTLGAGDTFISFFLTLFNHNVNYDYLLTESTTAATEVCRRFGTFGHPL